MYDEVSNNSGGKTCQPNSREFDLSSYLFKKASFKSSKQVQPVEQQYNEAKLVNNMTTKAIGISASLNNTHFKLSALFLQYALPVFENANAFLQKDEPVIHILHDVLISQLSDLLAHLLTPEKILSPKLLTHI